ncbi:MAG: ABC transporter ATP-binding protein [Halodesulfurarchaeum sp.]
MTQVERDAVGPDREPTVRFENVTKRFPGVLANDRISFAVESGTVHALLGENGAGKTTLMKILYGLYTQDEGTVSVRGQPSKIESPRDAIDAGIGMIHQHFKLIDPFTVAENITLGFAPTRAGGIHFDRTEAREDVERISDRYGLNVDPDATVADISVGEQQRVEILKSLYRGAEILILDEPTAVLTPQEIEELFEVVEELREKGKTIIFITHKLGEAMRMADSITVLQDGKNIGTVDSDAVSEPELAEMMVGREVLMERTKRPQEPGDRVLSVSELAVEDRSGAEIVKDVSFAVREGEIFGIAGVDGNGQSQLIEAITGLRDPAAGDVNLGGEDITEESRREHVHRGMAYVPEDRQKRGLVMDFDLTENTLLGVQHTETFAAARGIDWERTRDRTHEIVEEYDVRTPNIKTTAESLSGGNQQKFVVGRELFRGPEMVVASHPTRGVDVGSIEFIHDRLLSLRSDETAVLLVSSKLDEILDLADRVAVMYEGEFVDVVDPDTVTEEQLGLLMGGERPDRDYETDRAMEVGRS